MIDTTKPCLCFFDWDGTLRTRPSSDGMPSENIEALRKLQSMGHKIILNSGRSYGNYPPFALEVLPWDAVIAGCAFVKVGEQILLSQSLSKAALLHAIDIWEKHHFTCLLEGQKTTYVIGEKCHWLDITENAAAYINEHYEEMNVTNICIEDDTTGLGDDVFDQAYVTYHGSYTEVNIQGYYKDTGMRILSDYFGIPMTQTIAFGDSVNDIRMLDAAETAVLMPSAPKEMDSLADYRAKDPISGVAEAIHHFFRF